MAEEKSKPLEKLDDRVEREELIRRGFEERKLPINYFYKTENNNPLVYYLTEDGDYKRVRNVIPGV